MRNDFLIAISMQEILHINLSAFTFYNKNDNTDK